MLNTIGIFKQSTRITLISTPYYFLLHIYCPQDISAAIPQCIIVYNSQNFENNYSYLYMIYGITFRQLGFHSNFSILITLQSDNVRTQVPNCTFHGHNIKCTVKLQDYKTTIPPQLPYTVLNDTGTLRRFDHIGTTVNALTSVNHGMVLNQRRALSICKFQQMWLTWQ